MRRLRAFDTHYSERQLSAHKGVIQKDSLVDGTRPERSFGVTRGRVRNGLDTSHWPGEPAERLLSECVNGCSATFAVVRAVRGSMSGWKVLRTSKATAHRQVLGRNGRSTPVSATTAVTWIPAVGQEI